MPASADTPVVALRQWLARHGGQVPTCGAGDALPPALSKREAMDRYTQHTKHCKHCSEVGREAPGCGTCNRVQRCH